MLVVTSESIDLSESNRTYRGRLARPAEFHGEVSAPADSEVVIKVSEPQEMGSRGMTFVTLTVESVIVDGKSVTVATLPVMRPLATVGRPTPTSGIVPAGTRLVFVVGATKG